MTSAIIFLGTPHNGSDHAATLGTAERIVAWAKLKPAVATNLTSELETYSTTVRDINRGFNKSVGNSLELVSFFETEPTRLPSFKKPADLVSKCFHCRYRDILTRATDRTARLCNHESPE